MAALPDACMEAFAREVAASILAGEEPDLTAAYIAAGFVATDRVPFNAQTLWEDEDIQVRIAAIVRGGVGHARVLRSRRHDEHAS